MRYNRKRYISKTFKREFQERTFKTFEIVKLKLIKNNQNSSHTRGSQKYGLNNIRYQRLR